MAIAQAIPSQLPRLVLAAYSQCSMTGAQAALSSLEAAFYSRLQGGVPHWNRAETWIRTTAISYIHETQIIFNIATAASILWSAKKLFTEAKAISTPAAAATLLSVATISAIGTALLHRFSPPLSEKKTTQIPIYEYRLNTKINTGRTAPLEKTETITLQQKIAKALHATQVVIHCSLAYFGQNRLLTIATLASTAYSLFQNSHLKWLNFSRVFENGSNSRIAQAKVTYHMLVLPPARAAEEETCAICLDDKTQTDMAFCAHHVFHKECLAQLPALNGDNFYNWDRCTKIKTRHSTNGVHTHTSYSYKIELPQENFPSCPSCREFPLQNNCSIDITDRVHGQIKASVTVQRQPADRQYLFENLNALYSAAQAGLVFLQTYPELAGAVYKIQKYMLGADLAALAVGSYYLFNKINAEYNPEDSRKYKYALAAGFVATGALSCFAALSIDAYMKPALALKDLVSQLPVEISWGSPLMHKLAMASMINRIAVTAALAFFSDKKKTNRIALLAQAIVLTGLARLQWIQALLTMNLPLQKIAANGGKLANGLHPKELKQLTLAHYFIVDRSCTAIPSHFKTTLQAISSYTASFFDKSSWDSCFRVTYTNGVEISRRLCYQITLQASELAKCGCSLLPSLAESSIRLVHPIWTAVPEIISG